MRSSRARPSMRRVRAIVRQHKPSRDGTLEYNSRVRQSALLLVSLAWLAAAPALPTSAAEPARCESPAGEAPAAQTSPAGAANERGNELARAGEPQAAIAAHREAE